MNTEFYIVSLMLLGMVVVDVIHSLKDKQEPVSAVDLTNITCIVENKNE